MPPSTLQTTDYKNSPHTMTSTTLLASSGDKSIYIKLTYTLAWTSMQSKAFKMSIALGAPFTIQLIFSWGT